MSYKCYCGDPPEFYHAEIRRARKPHRCSECNGAIMVGERYEHVLGKWDGYVDTFNTCERCHDIYQWTKNNVPCVCKTHGNMIEDCKLAVEEAVWRARDETVGLQFGLLRRIVMRNKLNDARRKGE